MSYHEQMVAVFLIAILAFGSGFAFALAIVEYQDATKSLQDWKDS